MADNHDPNHDDDLHALPTGHRLGEYVIERMLGQGGFGVTYLATHQALGIKRAIKEYYPTEFAVRDSQLTIRSRSGAVDDDYQWGLERFIEEAQTLYRFHDHPNIIEVIDVISGENGTAYMVMVYHEGETLQEAMDREGTLDADRVGQVLWPLLDALETIHAEDVFHRDIKPDNIYLTRDGTPLLLDFGAARAAVTVRTRSVSAIVAEGYSPFEQYSPDRDLLGPWSDIYALAATLYHAITGEKPEAATERSLGDTMASAMSLAADEFDDALLAALDHGLGIFPNDRPQSIADWQAEMTPAAMQPSTPSEPEPPPAPPDPIPPDPDPPVKPRRWPRVLLRIILFLVLVAAFVVGGFYFYLIWLERGGFATDPPAVPSGLFRVTTAKAGLNVRAGPGTEHASLGALRLHSVVRLLDTGERGPWRRVQFAGHDKAYVHSDFLADRLRDCPDCPEMMVIQPGRFQMGRDDRERESPRHPVALAQPFALGRTEVTVDAWLVCVRAGTCRPLRNPGGGNRPVTNMSWRDAEAYAGFLSEQTGRRYRLPSEAEWEYAARAGTATTYPWGDGMAEACRYENFYDHAKTEAIHAVEKPGEPVPEGNCDDGYVRIAPAASYRANPFGLHDMLGNVSEWVADCAQDDYAGAPNNGSARGIGEDCPLRVFRGGTAISGSRELEPTWREWDEPLMSNDNLGFRVARDLD